MSVTELPDAPIPVLQHCQTVEQAQQRAFFTGLSALRGRNLQRPITPRILEVAISQGLCIDAPRVRERAARELHRLHGGTDPAGGDAA